jgi:hypothetical protein
MQKYGNFAFARAKNSKANQNDNEYNQKWNRGIEGERRTGKNTSDWNYWVIKINKIDYLIKFNFKGTQIRAKQH